MSKKTILFAISFLMMTQTFMSQEVRKFRFSEAAQLKVFLKSNKLKYKKDLITKKTAAFIIKGKSIEMELYIVKYKTKDGAKSNFATWGKYKDDAIGNRGKRETGNSIGDSFIYRFDYAGKRFSGFSFVRNSFYVAISCDVKHAKYRKLLKETAMVIDSLLEPLNSEDIVFSD